MPDGYAPYYDLTNATYIDPAPNKPATDLGIQGTAQDPVTGAKPQSVTVLTNSRKTQNLTVLKDASPTTDEEFDFTLKLWSISESNAYNIPAGQYDSSKLTHTGPGTYTFKLRASQPLTLTLPAGIRYRVTETPTSEWTLMSEMGTTGLLDSDKQAVFTNVKNETLQVVKIWKDDNDGNNAIMRIRPTSADAVGIRVVTQDNTSRWKITGPEVLTDIVGTLEQQAAYNAVRALYNASTLIPDLMENDGTTVHATSAPKKIYLSSWIGTLLPPGDYVADAVAGNSGQLTIYPVENVPFEHIYTVPDSFSNDDGNGNWLYEFVIPKSDDILSVEEIKIPTYYQKEAETAVYVDGEVVYQVTNTLDVRDLEIAKETAGNLPGTLDYTIQFYFDTPSSGRKPYTPAQLPTTTTVTGADGTYQFSLSNGGKIVFKDLPLGVSYEITEMDQDRWSLIDKVNDRGVMDQKNDNSGKVSEIWIYNGREYATRAEAEAAAASDVLPTASAGNTIYTNTATYSNIDTAIAASIIKNMDNTWTYDVVNNYSSYDEAKADALAAVNRGNNRDNTYIFEGNTYYTRKAVERIACADIAEVEDNGVTLYEFGGTRYSSYAEAQTAAQGAVTVSGTDENEEYVYNGARFPSAGAASLLAGAAITDNADGTYTFSGTIYNSWADAYAAAMADNNDSSYTYQDVVYPSLAEASAVAFSAISPNNDNTYTVDRQVWPTYNDAKAIAASLITTNTSSDGTASYTVNVTYDLKYDAEKAAKQAITKKPYEPREAEFSNAPLYDITINKTVSGNMGNKAKEWTFDITIPSIPGKTITAKKAASEGPKDVQLFFSGGGKATFTLYHEETLTIPGLLYGTKYSISETNGAGYTISTSVAYTEPAADVNAPPVPKKYSFTGAKVPEHTMLSDHAVTYANHRDTPVPTGVSDSISAALAGIASAFVLLGVLRLAKRRREYNN